ncbi:MAG: gliding motility-associated C-terminal domain-containing protein [Sphingobacteriales bacterium]|nr:gliding motility-associated C-terminal domain-containing protein [Sphingobacteriales bacterium]
MKKNFKFLPFFLLVLLNIIGGTRGSDALTRTLKINTVSLPPPTITTLSPNPVTAGQTLTITGTEFTGATSLTIGGVSVPFTVASATSITVVVPLGTSSGKVTITTPDGTADGTVQIGSNTTVPNSTGWSGAWQKITTSTAGTLSSVVLNLGNTSSNAYGLYLELHSIDADPSSANPFFKFNSLIASSATTTVAANASAGEVNFTFGNSPLLAANTNYYVVLKAAAGSPSITGGQSIYFNYGPTDGGAGNNFGTLYYKFSMAPYLIVINPANISVTSNLTNFSTCVGFASVTQSFTVNASYLTAPLGIVAPSNFEISTNPTTGFASTLTLNPSGGGNTITSLIYVRLATSATGNPSGSIALTSTGASTVNVAVNGTVNAKPAVPTVSNVTACQDLSLPNTFLSALTATGTNLLWYTSATGGVGSATAPTPSASNPGTTSYWVTQTTSGCESDRAQIDVLINPVPTVNQPPNQTIINGTAIEPINFVGTVPNTIYNWTILNSGWGIPTTGVGNIPAYVVTSSTGSPSSGTTIIVTPTANGCVGAPRNILLTILIPWITVNGTINPFSTCEGSPSASQSFNVSGSNLTGPLSISAPFGFEISTNETTGFASTLTLNPSSAGTITALPIYVRLAASATGTPMGTIQFASINSNNGWVWIDVSGTVNAKSSAPIVSNITTCPNTNLSALSATGSNLLWYTSATGGVGSATAPTPSASTSGTTSYWVTQTTSACESDRARLDVIVHPVPTVNQPTNVLVQNGTATPPVIFTGAVSPTTFAWTSSNTSFGLSAGGTGNIASFTANYTGGGNVQQVVSTIVVTPSANGCVGTAKTFTFTLNLNAAPTNISLSKANLFEANALGATVGNLSSTDPDVGDTHSYTLVAGSGGGDNASFTIVGNQLKANAVFNFATKRLYTVRIRTTDAGGLPFEKEFLISISKTPVVLGTGNAPSTKKQTAPSVNPSISKGYSSFLTVTGENLTGYSWSPSTGLSANNIANPVASPVQTTTYNVTVTNSFGSTTVVPITITVVQDYNVTPNNILTPNGDGSNDTWAVENIASYPNNEVKVVDKAGRLVFTQKGYANTWDGANLTPDTYYYIIIFGPDVAPKKGFITIIR